MFVMIVFSHGLLQIIIIYNHVSLGKPIPMFQKPDLQMDECNSSHLLAVSSIHCGMALFTALRQKNQLLREAGEEEDRDE